MDLARPPEDRTCLVKHLSADVAGDGSHGEAVGATRQRVEHVRGVERLPRREGTGAAVAPVEQAGRALDDDGCGDGVDVPSRGTDPSGVTVSAYDDVHDELLARAAGLVDRGGWWRRLVAEIDERGGVEVGAELADVEMPVDRDDLGERELHD